MIRIAIVLICLATLHSAAEAQGPSSADLALAVAKVCANEASLGRARPADCALIWQATRRHGATRGERLDWLSRHSNCVLGTRDFTESEARGNCRWSRHLTPEGERPEGWIEGIPWEGRYRSRWLAMYRYVSGLVAGAVPRDGWPCEQDPDTWGGPMDRARARRVGMVPLQCRGTANEGYRYGALASR